MANKLISFLDKDGCYLHPKARWEEWDGEVPQKGDMVTLSIDDETTIIGEVLYRHINSIRPKEVRVVLNINKDEEKLLREYGDTILWDMKVNAPYHWNRFISACHVNNIRTIRDLMKVSPFVFMKTRNCGVKCIEAAQRIIKEQFGLEWK